MHQVTETCGHQDKIIYGCVRLNPETILMSFKLTANYVALGKLTPYGSLTATPKYRSKRCSDVGRDDSVGVAIRYELVSPGIESD